MKHFYQQIIILLCLFCTVTIAHAKYNNDCFVDGIHYVLSGDEAIVVESEYKKYSGSIIIPSTITYSNKQYLVTSIENNAFRNCSKLTNITIPNSVKSIGGKAFYNCITLTSIDIPENVTEINNETFYGCKNLSNVSVNNIKSIGSYAFGYCSNLTSFSIPKSVKTIGESAFYGCSSLKNITIPDGMTSIENSTFGGCSSLISFNIPNSVTTIGMDAFYNCTSLNGIIIPNGVTSIGIGAFQGCKSLTTINIPYSVTSIDISAFYGCSISSVTLHDNIKYIGLKAFDDNCTIFVNRGTTTLLAVWKSRLVPYEISTCKKLEPPTISLISTTQSTATLSVNNLYNEYYYSFDHIGGKQLVTSNEMTITHLRPEYTGDAYLIANLTDKDNIIYDCTSIELTTKNIKPTIKFKTTPSAIIVNGSYIKGDAHVKSVKLSFYKDKSLKELAFFCEDSTYTLTGLDPNQKYYGLFEVKVNFGNDLNNSYIYKSSTAEICTSSLYLTTLTPKVTNKGEAIVCATTNISDDETNVGFEWRKIDAPDVIPSKTGAAVIYNGTMEGMIKNLDTSAYWKVRPYYESAASNKYYGEWVGFDPSDFSFFEPTVHTYANVVVTEGTAILTGYVMAGTDAVKEQGFEYWAINGNNVRSNRAEGNIVQKVIGTGQKMVVQLSDLYAGTKYNYRAYVKTSRGTTYGEEMSFTTKDHVVDAVESATTEERQLKIVGYYNLQGRRLSKPEQGKLNIIRYSDGTTKKIIIMP